MVAQSAKGLVGWEVRIAVDSQHSFYCTYSKYIDSDLIRQQLCGVIKGIRGKKRLKNHQNDGRNPQILREIYESKTIPPFLI